MSIVLAGRSGRFFNCFDWRTKSAVDGIRRRGRHSAMFLRAPYGWLGCRLCWRLFRWQRRRRRILLIDCSVDARFQLVRGIKASEVLNVLMQILVTCFTHRILELAAEIIG